MHQVHLELTDEVYDKAMRRAVDAGFKTSDEFIAEVVFDELTENGESLDHLFRPERLALIDKAEAQNRAG